MNDIVERLRPEAATFVELKDAFNTMREAADEIERLKAALHEVYSQLTNMQPHIASLEEHCGNVGRTRFIDDHVDEALDVARKALEIK